MMPEISDTVDVISLSLFQGLGSLLLGDLSFKGGKCTLEQSGFEPKLKLFATLRSGELFVYLFYYRNIGK